MKILITGGTGFVGSYLSDTFIKKGYHVISIGGPPPGNALKHPNLKYVLADTTQKGSWQEELNNIDAVINLAGRSIFSRWNDDYKKSIYDSRILTTRNLVEALPSNKNITLCSTSAAGYYGDRKDDILTENESPGNDFLAKVCKDWENEAFKAEKKGVRVTITRFGIVLGKGGGALKQMIPPIRFFVGGPLGNGQQWFPWIHIEDLISAMLFIFENESVSGALNFTSPEPIRNIELVKTIAGILHRPAIMPAPAFFIKLFLGEFGSSILASQRVTPEKLLQYGFKFKYPDIKSALKNIIEKGS
ncbi:MAG: TIGR01777 family oxidoreductase [Proteobacteria bacterium]|nr:TIGR01777 family oxidoreductase [Pseudomonadota bacterium]